MEAKRVTKETTREGPRENRREGEERGKKSMCYYFFFLRGATRTGREDEAVRSREREGDETRRQRNYGLLTEHATLGQRGSAEDLTTAVSIDKTIMYVRSSESS